MKISLDVVRATVVVCASCLLIDAVAVAQSSRDRKRDDDAPSAIELEMRLKKAETALVDEYKEVAIEFYNQGDKETSMAMLRRLKQLSPSLEGLGNRIKAMNEELMQENANSIEIDTRKVEWLPVGNVMEGKAFRMKASGEYKITLTTTVGVEGMQTDEKAKNFVSTAPIGSLMAAIVTDGKPGRPFPVKAEMEHTPKKGGQLFLKLNVPEGTRCIGKIKVGFSGYIDTGKRKSP